jgi:kynureninase
MKKKSSARFFHAGSQGWLYFDANSIGAMPKAAPARMQRLLAEWRALRRRGWSESDWLDAPRRLGDKLAPVIGAPRGSVIVGDSTSVNLHKALTMAVTMASKRRPGRKEILSETGTFPTDLYVAEGVARSFRLKLRLVEGPDQVAAAIGSRTAVVYLSHTDYRTAYRHDLAAVTRRAHARGALAVWDLSHSAGAVATDIGRGNADFAVGCGYKYLCGGPGAPGYLYVAPRLQGRVQPALQGWFGHADPMAFSPRFKAARGIQRHAVGSPAVAGNVLMEAALDVFQAMKPRSLFKQHAALSQLLIELAPVELVLASPADPGRRGGFVAFRHRHAGALVEELQARRVVASLRPPNIVRFGLSPLYHSEADVRALARRLKAILG